MFVIGFGKNGKQVDPFKQNLPPGKSIPNKLKSNFDQFILPLKNQIDQITSN